MRADKNLNPEDLIEDQAFRDWVFHNTNSESWKEWLTEHPEHRPIAETARHLLLSLRGEVSHLSKQEIKSEIQRLLVTVQTHGQAVRKYPEEKAKNSLTRRLLRWRNIAAAFIVLAGTGSLLYLSLDRQETESAPLVISENRDPDFLLVSNESKVQKLVNLPDGSSALLMKASSIRFPRVFEKEKREVTLSGEAFFEIRKDQNHPFYVFAGEMVTRVLGTSFTIKAYDNDPVVNVRVKSGKVSVAALPPGSPLPTIAEMTNEIVLLPNQQAVLSRSDRTIAMVEREQENEVALPIEELVFEFRRTPVTEVFAIIQKAYNINVKYDAQLLQNCSITASLGDEPLSEKLNMICEVIGATYQVEDDIVHINATGCQ